MIDLLLCVSQDETRSRMFTVGKTYLRDESGTVLDDLNRLRFIGSSLSFIVENNSPVLYPPDPEQYIKRAYFQILSVDV